QFNVDFKGYAATEVDEFLDSVIEDYQKYDSMIQELGERLQRFEAEIQTLRNRNIELEGIAASKQEQPVLSNVDIIKRLSRLEAEVFKK
ncbi:MAG: DivIVA domain-containing protein, partial [Erysipelotrichaceae bacterium]